MTAQAVSPTSAEAEVRDSWVPMIVIGMGQALMSFNVAALPVSMGGMVESFNTPPTTLGTAIVMYSLFVSGFIMLGAKLGQRFGSKIFFQTAVALFLAAMVTMVVSPTAEVMLAAQGLAGFAGAALVPTLVVLIATHYRGKRQAEALGWLGSARAMAGVLAFLVIGTLERFVSLVTSSPKELSGDVGALRGVTNNLAASVGTAVMGALVIGILAAGVARSLTANPVIPAELKSQVDLDNINFLSNDRLQERLAQTTASPEQVAEAVRINTEERLRALKIAFFVLGSLALLAIFPSTRLPYYKPGEVPSGQPSGE
jgi:MFS family permease